MLRIVSYHNSLTGALAMSLIIRQDFHHSSISHIAGQELFYGRTQHLPSRRVWDFVLGTTQHHQHLAPCLS